MDHIPISCLDKSLAVFTKYVRLVVYLSAADLASQGGEDPITRLARGFLYR
jgi:hypothetical protein